MIDVAVALARLHAADLKFERIFCDPNHGLVAGGVVPVGKVAATVTIGITAQKMQVRVSASHESSPLDLVMNTPVDRRLVDPSCEPEIVKVAAL